MSAAITLGGLLLGLSIIGGLTIAAFGLLIVFAGGMSDAPAQGEAAVGNGCLVFAFGVIVLAASLLGLVL